VTWRSALVAWAALGGLLLAAAEAGAQAERPRPRPINVDVTISYLTRHPPEPPPLDAPGFAPRGSAPVPPRVREIDERLRRIDAALRGQFVYDDIKLVERHRMVLDVDEVGTVKLPNGKRFRVRPLDVDASGVLMAVDVGSKKLDVRAPSRHLTIIGAEPYRDGQLVVSIEPNY
jgi:hypothetical protein